MICIVTYMDYTWVMAVFIDKEGVDALTIALDSKYIELVEEVRKSLELFSGNKVRVYLRGNCYN